MAERHTQAEAPHFTREMLVGSLRYFRQDLEATLSGDTSDERARNRLQAAQRFGLDKLAPEAIAAVDAALRELETKQWPRNLAARFLALAGAIRAMAEANNVIANDSPHADLTQLAKAMARIEQAVRQSV